MTHMIGSLFPFYVITWECTVLGTEDRSLQETDCVVHQGHKTVEDQLMKRSSIWPPLVLMWISVRPWEKNVRHFVKNSQNFTKKSLIYQWLQNVRFYLGKGQALAIMMLAVCFNVIEIGQTTKGISSHNRVTLNRSAPIGYPLTTRLCVLHHTTLLWQEKAHGEPQQYNNNTAWTKPWHLLKGSFDTKHDW